MLDSEIIALISLLDDEDHEVASHVEEKIISLGEKVIPFLENEWENNLNPIIQKKIEELIHYLQFELLKKRLTTWKDNGYRSIMEGMVLVANYLYPDLDLLSVNKEFEQLYYEVWTSFRSVMHPYDQIRTMNGILFNNLKFRSNTKNFHSPSNSMINIVLETKKGNPLSLCVIYMMIAQKLGMPVFGVNLPNLFILTYKSPQIQFYINVFNRGLIFEKADIDNYLSQLNIEPRSIFYDPCSNLDIVQRVLRNLIVAFDKMGEHEKAEEVKVLLHLISNERSTL